MSTLSVATAPCTRARVRQTPVSASVIWRRRATVLAAFILAAFLLTVAIGRVGAQADLAERSAGHVVVQPGETLWDVASATAPEGVDVREQLDRIQVLNGLDGTQLPAWTVVLLPAR